VTSDATRYIILRTATGASFADNGGVRSNPLYYDATKGVAIRATGAYNVGISCSVAYTRFEKLQIHMDAFGGRGLEFNAGNCRVTDCIIHAQRGTINSYTGTVNVANCLLTVSQTTYTVLFAYTGNIEIYGCTCIHLAATGSTTYALDTFGNITAKNCAFFGGDSISGGGGAEEFTYNYCATDQSSFGTISGGSGNNLTSLTFADQFEDSTNDFRSVDTGDLHAGTPDATNTPDDISGQDRDDTTPWIGCWELVSADVFTATAAVTIGGATCAAAATFSPGTKTATAAVTIGAATCAATASVPFIATAALQLGGPIVSGREWSVVPASDPDQIITFANQYAWADGLPVIFPVNALGLTPGRRYFIRDLDAFGGNSIFYLAEYVGGPVVTLSGASDSGQFSVGGDAVTCSVAATFTAAGTNTAAAAVTMGAATCAASATFAPGTKTSTAAVTAPRATASASATHVRPTYTASAALTIGHATCAASGIFASSVFQAALALTAPAATCAAAATFTPGVLVGPKFPGGATIERRGYSCRVERDGFTATVERRA